MIGNQELLKRPCVGFSGSRHVSEKGLWITADCASQLAKEGVCVVSGYANGVDFTAHKTALEQDGTTIIVLPEGIDAFYIRKELSPVWDWNRVLVVSEFMPQDKWLATRAMRRNQTIIGLSDTMLVIEAGETGGSLDAGMKTISYGKSLFVPDYAAAPQSALGNNILLRKGANSLRRSRQSNCTNLDRVWMTMNGGKRENMLF
jgi:DNA processing protein